MGQNDQVTGMVHEALLPEGELRDENEEKYVSYKAMVINEPPSDEIREA